MRHMKGRPAFGVAIIVIVALAVSFQPAVADTSGPDGVVMSLFAGSVIVSGANLIAIALYDGSTGLGIAGIALGSGLVTYSLVTESVEEGDEGVFVGVGVATTALGLVDLLIARSGKKDPEWLGMRVSPSIRSFDGERWIGFQLISR